MDNEEILAGPVVEKAEERVKESDPSKKMRQIVIETDGNDIKLVSAEVSGKIELVAILEGVIGFIRSGGK